MKIKNYQHKARILLFLLLLLLFHYFVWEQYIVNPTAADALEEEDGEKGFLLGLDKERSFGVKRLENGFGVYAISEGIFGWTVTDHILISNKSNEGKLLNIKMETMEYKDNEKLSVILFAAKNEEVANLVVYDNQDKKVGLGKVPSGGLDLYYFYSEEPLNGAFRYEVYSAEKGILDQGTIRVHP